jgi:hypothetical protein
MGTMALAFMLAIVLALLGPGSAAAQRSPEQELVERFAPVMMLREQEADCDHDGEGYFPAPVDFLFNNPDMRLMANAGGDKKDDVVLAEGFTAQDLVSAGPDTYLDFPGNPRDPGCTYETYFKQMAAELGLEPTTYARIVIDPVSRRLYIQYWFFYYFNHWNNTHESDWEMIQVVFEGTQSVEEALEFGPSSVAFAQHGGGELSRWNDEKLQKQGDQPVAFPSAGSHGTYYGQHTFIGWGENGTAFGCDNTTPPSVETPLNVILVPEVIDPDGEFAFLLYEGNWGERDFAMFEGPKGPNMGGKWNEPTEAIENWRDSTLKVPDSSFGGVSTTDVFCTLSEWGSKAVIYMGSHPGATLLILLGVLAVIGFIVYKIWFYFTEALDIYGNELVTFLGIGSLVIPIGMLGTIVSEYLIEYQPMSWMYERVDGSNSGSMAVSLVVGSLQQLLMILMVTPAVIYAMKDIRRGINPGVWRSFRGSIKSLPISLPVILTIVLTIVVGTLSIVLIPIAIYLVIRWQFGMQAGIIDNQRPFTRALGASWGVTRGNWLKALFGSIAFQLMVIIPGPLVGALVLIVGGSKVGFANFLSSFIYALTIPIATIGVTMLYHRFAGHEIVEPDMVTKAAAEVEGGMAMEGGL